MRAFSLGMRQLARRAALFMFIRENDVLGKRSIHDLTNTKGVEIAEKLELAMIAVGAIGDPNNPGIPAWYVRGPLATAADVGVQHLVDAWGARPTMADLQGRKAVKMSDLRARLPRLETADDYQDFVARVRAEGNVNPRKNKDDWQV